MLERLTEDQEALMVKVREDWINFALLSGDELDEDAARAGIEWMYELTNLKKPMVIFVDSPLGVQYAANIITLETGKKGQVGDQVRGQVWGQVSDQVWGQVRGQVSDQVWDQVRGQVRGQVWDQVWDQVSDQVSDQVWGQVSDQVSDQVWGQVSDQVRGQVGDQVWGQVGDQKLTVFDWSWRDISDAGWVSFYDFFAQIGVHDHQGLKKYLDYLRSGVFMGVFLDGCAIVCRRPQAVRRDDQTRLHNDQKPAIEWRDGYKLYYIHGQHFEEDLWTKITGQKMTVKEVMAIGNADQRVMAWSMLRPDRLLKGMKAKLLHTGIKGTRLYQVDNFMDTKDTEYCMVMDDASTDRQFLEWVPPEIGKQKDADLCQANAFQIPLEDYLLMEQEA